MTARGHARGGTVTLRPNLYWASINEIRRFPEIIPVKLICIHTFTPSDMMEDEFVAAPDLSEVVQTEETQVTRMVPQTVQLAI